MAGIIALQRACIRRALNNFSRRFVSTTKKNNETITAECVQKAKVKAEADKNWVSYGFEHYNKTADRQIMHSVMFLSITLCMVVGGYYLAYYPDFKLNDWARREAFLELRRREKLGLPLIDPNFIDPSKICLPSDEELGDTEIIV